MSKTENQTYFQYLQQEVNEGRLEIFIQASPPRCGSTIINKWAGTFNVNGIYIEPAAKYDTPEQRVERTYEDIAKEYDFLRRRREGIGPVRMFLKETASHIAPVYVVRVFWTPCIKI